MEADLLGRESCSSCGLPWIALVFLIDRQGAPPGDPAHMITYSHRALFACGACGRGEIERFEHDCFDFEDVWNQYEWYRLEPVDLQRLRGLLATCPAPLSGACVCTVHESLRAGVRRLPSSSWETLLEAKRHTHRVRLAVDRGLPVLELVS